MDWVSLSDISRELAARMADASVRALVLGLLALLLIPFIRRSSTAQHTLWTLVLTGMLVLPFLRPIVPATHVRLPQVLTPQFTQARPVPSSSMPPRISRPATETRLPEPPHWPLFLVAAYLAGVALFGARLLGGLLLTRRALRNTRTIHSELWEHYELIADANVDLNLEESDYVRVPLTTGSTLVRVIFPADWREWPAEKRKAVLAHELAHARRRDPLLALVVAINKCLFWFHPLAWWLERRLPVLAEHAADDAALAVSFDTQAYARLLLDSAARKDTVGGRLIWHSAAISGPVIAQRIRRVLDVRTAERLRPLGRIGWTTLVAVGVTLIWISTAVDVPRLVAGQAIGPATAQGFPWQMTSEQVAALEQELATNPENETARGRLLEYYTFNEFCTQAIRNGLPPAPECRDHDVQTGGRRTQLILWLIDHRPESDLLKMAVMFPQLDPNGYEDFRNRWLTQVNLHPNDARVLVNAAGAVRGWQERIDLLKRARTLDPERGTEPLARLYSSILVSVNEPGLAAQVRSELQSSSDIALVGSVARQVVEGAAQAAVSHASTSDPYALRILATELVTHAQSLEPQNREWSDLMEGVKVLPDGGVPPAADKAPAGVQTIRVGGMVSKANLQESPAPDYPPLAKAAGVQGTVKLQIRVGLDGHVKEATAISGHPLLIQAAKDAAMRYVYKPTILNGKPAEVLTDVEIVFRGS
jgi:beta-lactamase regulating signal transducer with metallopeptidase domain